MQSAYPRIHAPRPHTHRPTRGAFGQPRPAPAPRFAARGYDGRWPPLIRIDPEGPIRLGRLSPPRRRFRRRRPLPWPEGAMKAAFGLVVLVLLRSFAPRAGKGSAGGYPHNFRTRKSRCAPLKGWVIPLPPADPFPLLPPGLSPPRKSCRA